MFFFFLPFQKKELKGNQAIRRHQHKDSTKFINEYYNHYLFMSEQQYILYQTKKDKREIINQRLSMD